ncbi:PadR family transcriptional regulator [Sporolactobacillus shoreicorticis]|uniref:PadR family transcriptional regulator n=1 Tax=Sporolactobacillus shoreicorticis TaxID=1923877 RepID=A0ABW5S9W0_9BACL|nr:PadR family transcriptional regulator [Sporolactobacillus shoreicorticis]MCO7128205.1 PadR family transcriptional regulator [Sporolactobacillus shoreicorticis]
MKQTQLLKGTLEGCVLLISLSGKIYAYEMVQCLQEAGFRNMVSGTVYPLLQKLNKKGYFSCEMEHSPEGPDRKYYYITPKGKEQALDFVKQWKQLTFNVNELIDQKEQWIN